MSLVNCHECGKEVSTEAKLCPNCGAKVKTKSNGLWMVSASIFTGLILTVIFASRSPVDPAMARDRGLIEQCWRDQERKSLDPGSARYMAGMCENFERDFRARWNRTP